MNSSGYNHRYYVKHKRHIIKRWYDRAAKRKKVVRKTKDRPCADCKKRYPYWIMEFDHVRGKKLFNIGEGFYKFGLKKVLEEIAKCEIVCANCHHDRTYKRFKRLYHKRNKF